jgi:hypothetical protein
MPIPGCCENCQAGFEGYAPLKLSALKSGNNVLIYAENQSRSIVLVKRIIVCGVFPSYQLFLYLRKPNFVVGDQIEQGTTYLMAQLNNWATGPVNVQVEAEYIEFTGRSQSKCYHF